MSRTSDGEELFTDCEWDKPPDERCPRMATFSVESVMIDKAYQMCDEHTVPFLHSISDVTETVRIVFV